MLLLFADDEARKRYERRRHVRSDEEDRLPFHELVKQREEADKERLNRLNRDFNQKINKENNWMYNFRKSAS